MYIPPEKQMVIRHKQQMKVGGNFLEILARDPLFKSPEGIVVVRGVSVQKMDNGIQYSTGNFSDICEAQKWAKDNDLGTDSCPPAEFFSLIDGLYNLVKMAPFLNASKAVLRSISHDSITRNQEVTYQTTLITAALYL